MDSILRIVRRITIHLVLLHRIILLNQVVIEDIFHEDSQTLKVFILNGIKIHNGIC